MDLFEYQAKELFAKHNVPTTPGRVTDTAVGAREIATEIGRPVMVKAQVKVGGRGGNGRSKGGYSSSVRVVERGAAHQEA